MHLLDYLGDFFRALAEFVTACEALVTAFTALRKAARSGKG